MRRKVLGLFAALFVASAAGAHAAQAGAFDVSPAEAERLLREPAGDRRFVVLAGLCGPSAAAAMGGGPEAVPLEKIRLPPGFRIGVYAGDVPGARSMALGDRGTVFVGTRREGKVYAVPDRDGDGRAERPVVIARGLRMPNGVAFRDGALYVAEASRVLRFDGIESRLADPGTPAVVNDAFPRDAHHGWKYRNRIFIADHGSWNRSTPIGCRVTTVGFGEGGAAEYVTFARGWLEGGEAWGRPVDVLVMPDGALLVSDDRAGVLYRIRYEGAGAPGSGG